MVPILNENANSLDVVSNSPKDINVGDIISYSSKASDDILIHRVVEIGQDSEGWYAIAKGDNNQLPNPYKIRFDQIQRMVIGVIY